MHILRLNTHLDITQENLIDIAWQVECWHYEWLIPFDWKLVNGNLTNILNALDTDCDIEYESDNARDELDDVVIWLRWLDDLIDIVLHNLSEKFPNENIEWYFTEMLDYHKLIVKHADEARNSVVSICTAIDPAYEFTKVPTHYTVIS